MTMNKNINIQYDFYIEKFNIIYSDIIKNNK